ncbi:MAG: hypothetical protein U0359_00510 [Byssovorax sp.]
MISCSVWQSMQVIPAFACTSGGSAPVGRPSGSAPVTRGSPGSSSTTPR